MSLTDTDKDSPNRGEPKLNHHDQALQHLAAGTNSTNHITEETDTTGNSPILFGFARFIKFDNMTVVNNGGTLTTSSQAHGLDFIPVVIANLNNATITTAGGSVIGASVALPIFTSADISGASIAFKTWLYAFADDTNVYVNLVNTTGAPISVTVTYYLYQQAADQAAS